MFADLKESKKKKNAQGKQNCSERHRLTHNL